MHLHMHVSFLCVCVCLLILMCGLCVYVIQLCDEATILHDLDNTRLCHLDERVVHYNRIGRIDV